MSAAICFNQHAFSTLLAAHASLSLQVLSMMHVIHGWPDSRKLPVLHTFSRFLLLPVAPAAPAILTARHAAVLLPLDGLSSTSSSKQCSWCLTPGVQKILEDADTL